MVLEIAQPVAFLLSLLSLYTVFHAAFLTTATTLADRAQDGLLHLAFAAAFTILAGLLFREADLRAEAQFDAEFHAHFGGSPSPAPTSTPFSQTLPVRLFCWATALMLLLFAVSWYIETFGDLHPNVRY